ncbi:inhibin beta chain [Elysia marginata]|uniref:Inhibin beta chain n=1 Tax=Elysia marginata TaxID=1093978 RepID=A0AAV4J1X3_9GAST|nr:inhibin beta chain [Elysia marginata]
MSSQLISHILASMTILMLTVPYHQSRRVGQNNRFFQAITRVINEEKIKQRIMRGLNLTNNQEALPGSPRDLPTRQGEMKTTADPMTSNNQHQTLTVYSRDSGTVNSNSFSFTLDSRVHFVAQNIQTAKLVLHLWDSRGNRKQRRRVRRRRFRRKLRKRACKDKEVNSALAKSQKRFKDEVNTQNHMFLASLSNHRLDKVNDTTENQEASAYRMRLSRKCNKRNKEGGRKKKTPVKIVVRSLLTGTKWKRRIAMRKTKVHRFGKTTLNLRLPQDVIKDAMQTADNTLKLQISCKRCGRHVHLDRVMTATLDNKHTKDPMKMWLNPYRPYLFIQYRKINTEHKQRRKRALQMQCFNNADSFQTPRGESVTSGCCSQRLWVTFEELGLKDLILYPDGFSTEVCSGTCVAAGASPSAFSEESTLLSNEQPASPLPENSSNSSLSGDIYPQRNNIDWAPNPAASLKPGESQLVERRQPHCAPLYKRPLLLWYIEPSSNDIVAKEIPDLIHESCGCLY